MSAKMRNLIAAQTLQTLRSVSPETSLLETRDIIPQITLEPRSSNGGIRFCLRRLLRDTGIGGERAAYRLSPRSLSQFIRDFPVENQPVTAVTSTEDTLLFTVPRPLFVETVLRSTASRPPGYSWMRNALFQERGKERIVVEFSSPNIAKPFHVGHFRSAVVGNYVANIHQVVGHHVVKINYLGDWGTQFGYLLAGMERFNIHLKDLEEDALSTLLDVYVKANKLGKTEPGFQTAAREAFNRLERGDQDLRDTWQYCRAVSVQQLKKMYARLNIAFDEYDGESMYSIEKNTTVLEELDQLNLLTRSEDGRRFIDLDRDTDVAEGSSKRGRLVTVVKSDGSSLYVSRDIAAAMDRRARFNFSKMFYVVDNSQGSHFSNLFEILGRMNRSWSADCHHVKFGKIIGLSTRQGNIVKLENIIDEAKHRMQENQKNSPNTKTFGFEGEATAEQLGISALLIHDLKQRRTKDYKFSWDKALSSSGDTGVRLQYAHARLCSLLRMNGCYPRSDNISSRDGSSHSSDSTSSSSDSSSSSSGSTGNSSDSSSSSRDSTGSSWVISECLDASLSSLESEGAAIDLILIIGRWEEVLSQSYAHLDPCSIVQFLFVLASSVNKALNTLSVKDAPDRESARARLLLFYCARKVLAEGLEILGVQPLERM